MRKIQTQDVFKLARIMKAAKLKDEISDIVEKINNEKSDNGLSQNDLSEKVGIQIFLTFVENCSDEEIEAKIYDLIGGIAEMPAKDIKSQSLDATLDTIKKISAENNMMAFFNQAGSLQ